MEVNKFDTIDYLKYGSEIQRQVFDIIQESSVLNILNDFNPVLTGTFPLGIEVDNSDLDIICHVKDKKKFVETIKKYFSGYDKFAVSETANGVVIANFFFMGIEFEIFGQDKPVREQNSYIHMINEYRLLQIHGEAFRKQIVELKRNGMKTEPAFACLLGLEGDAYHALLTVF